MKLKIDKSGFVKQVGHTLALDKQTLVRQELEQSWYIEITHVISVELDRQEGII